MFSRIKRGPQQLILAVNGILKPGDSPWNWEPQQNKKKNVPVKK